MNRAHVGNLEHAVALRLRKLSFDRNDSVNSVDEPLLVFTRFTIVSGDSAVLQFNLDFVNLDSFALCIHCLLYTSPSPRDATLSRMPSSA